MLRTIIIDVREFIGKLSLDYFVFSETKLDESFPSAHFYMSNYEIKNQRDSDQNGGGLIKLVRKSFITKRLKDTRHKFTRNLQYPRKNGSALVCRGHPLVITLLFSLKN